MDYTKLLAHKDFVHRLARRLVSDENQADDIAQQTWVAALENPPSITKSLRSWLSTVTRNFSRIAYRRDSKRRERELTATPQNKYPSPEETAHKMEIRRKLIDAVLSLKEPYCSSLVLHYYDNLSAKEIAEKYEIPLNTVRSRIKRGVAMLRQKLDALHQGDRRQWILAVTPIAGLKIGSVLNSSGVLSGVIAMSAKVKIAIAALICLGVIFSFYIILKTEDEGSSLPQYMSNNEAVSQVDSKKSEFVPVQKNNSIISSPSPDPIKQSLSPEGLCISGTVVSKETGKPITAFQFALIDLNESGYRVMETVRNKKGKFYFPLSKGGQFKLTVSSSCHLPMTLRDLIIPDKESLKGLEIKLGTGCVITGMVVEKKTGLPVAGALIAPSGRSGSYWVYNEIRDGRTEASVHTTSDKNGSFVLKGLFKEDQEIAALHPDFAQAWVKITPEEIKRIKIELKPGVRFYGKALDDSGKPMGGVSIDIRLSTQHIMENIEDKSPLNRGPYITKPDGTYRSFHYSPGHFHLKASPPPFSNFSIEQVFMKLKGQDLKVDFGTQKLITWKGTLYDYDNKPVSRGYVVVRPNLKYNRHSKTQGPKNIVCDENGCFEINKLALGGYFVISSSTPEHTGTNSVFYKKIFFDKPGLVEKDIHCCRSIISGKIVDKETRLPVTGKKGLVAAHIKENSYFKLRAEVDKEGCFEMRGIPPGEFLLRVEMENYQCVETQEIVINRNQVIENIQLNVQNGGYLKLQASNIFDESWKVLNLHMQHMDEPVCSSDHFMPIRKDGTLDEIIFLKPGKWRAVFSFRDLGMEERDFEIFQNKTTLFQIRKDDFSFYPGTLSVCGHLKKPDGSIVKEAKIRFTPIKAPGLQGENRGRKRVTTDSLGSFTANGFKPGTWGVQQGPMKINDSWTNRINYPNFKIPITSSDPHILNLVFPTGIVKGVLAPKYKLNEEKRNIRGCVQLITMDGFIVSEVQVSKLPANFMFYNVPSGQFHVVVNVKKHNLYKSSPFSVGSGEENDMGKVLVKHCGSLIIDLKDNSGKEIKWYKVFCNGEEIARPQRLTRDEKDTNIQYLLWDKLPIGKVKIRIHADNYKDIEKEVVLKPGEAVVVKQVLEFITD